jgi:hypothetical protein
MAVSMILEEESGTWTGSIHPHNGYYAGDFRDVPPTTQGQLDALMTVCRELAQPQHHH